MRSIVLIALGVSFSRSEVSFGCSSALDAMMGDPNYQKASTLLLNQCYVKYQNDVLLDSTTVADCRQREFESFCTDYLSGTSCRLNTGFVDVSVCVPGACSSDPVDELVARFSTNSVSTIDCSLVTSTDTPIVAAVVSTALVLAVTALGVFLLRPPQRVRESARLSKAQRNLISLSGSDSNSN